MLKNLMNLFVTFEEDPKGQKIKESEKEQSSIPVPKEESTLVGKKNEDIAKDLAGALEAANIEGYDYFEFAKTIDALKPSMPSEQTLYQTAFASGSVMGATKEKLIETAQQYLGVLGNKEKEFEAVVEEKNEALITTKEGQLRGIEEQLSTAAKQIQALTDNINELTQKKSEINNDISANRIKIEQVKNDFSATLQVFVGKINNDIEKINKYITPAQ